MPLTPQPSSPSGYRIALAHRRRPDVRPEGFREDLEGPYGELVTRLKPRLGCDAHTRLWVVDARRRAPADEPGARPQEVDLVEHFHFDSEGSYRAAFASEEARAAFRELSAFRGERVAGTGVVAGPVHAVVPFDGDRPFTRVLLLLRAAQGMSLGEMQRYWLESHGPLVRSLKGDLAMAGYEQHHSEGDSAPGLGALGLDDGDVFDGTASLIYPSVEALFGSLQSESGRAADQRLLADEAHFVDSAECIVVVGEEHA